MENVSPYVVLGALRNKTDKVILVNVLSDKMPYLINSSDAVNNMNFTKQQFEEYLTQHSNSLKDVSLVILYCASWSCGAAHNYYVELQSRKLYMPKIYDYKGALHEWAMYSIIFPNKYNLLNFKTNQKATIDELIQFALDTKHTYFLKDEKNAKLDILKELSISGTKS